jgi:hypothetical protein
MSMVVSTSPYDLREAAKRYRLLSSHGQDPRENAALLQLAEEFDQEAMKLEQRLAMSSRANALANAVSAPAQNYPGKST